jgi:hypothetical protein
MKKYLFILLFSLSLSFIYHTVDGYYRQKERDWEFKMAKVNLERARTKYKETNELKALSSYEQSQAKFFLAYNNKHNGHKEQETNFVASAVGTILGTILLFGFSFIRTKENQDE